MKQHVPTWYVVMVRHFNNNFVRSRLRTSTTANYSDKTEGLSSVL